MFNRSEILDAGSELVGFAHSYHPFYKRLDSTLKTSSSGYNVNSLSGVDFSLIEHSLYDEVSNVDLIVGEYYEIMNNDGAAFQGAGAPDNNVGTVFECTQNAIQTWGNGRLKLVSCNDYLSRIYNEELVKLVSSFVANNKDKLGSKEILSNESAVKGVSRTETEVAQDGRFIGFLINPANSQNVKAAINQIGFHASQGGLDSRSITIYLYVTSEKEAIKTASLNLSVGTHMNWDAVSDWIIQYSSDNYGTGEQYLIGYFEDDFTGTTYERLFDDGSLDNPRHYRVFAKHLGIAPVAIPSDKLDGNNLPDCNLEDYVTEYVYGLNFKFNVTCDITNVLVDNIDIFARPLQYAIAIRLLEDGARAGSDGVHNPVKDSMVNKWQSYATQYKGMLFGGIDQNGIRHKGFIDRLTMDFSNLDSICLNRKTTDLSVHRTVKGWSN